MVEEIALDVSEGRDPYQVWRGAWMVGQPDRLWLQKTDAQNNVSIMVLGIDDRCIFGGTPSTI